MFSDDTQVLREISKKIEKIPPLPKIPQQAMQLMMKSEFNMKELSDIISQDQALTIKILRWANSAYYGIGNPVNSIHQAVTYLGEHIIWSLLLTSSISSVLMQPLPGYDMEVGSLWKHSLHTAIIARELMIKRDEKMAEEAYTGGLLCDIGKIAMDVAWQEHKAENVDTVKEEDSPLDFIFVEQSLFGINHTIIGSKIAEIWGFPTTFQETIRYHHTPSRSEKNPIITSAVHISDVIVNCLGIGIGIDGLQYYFEPFAMQQLGLDYKDIVDFMDNVVDLLKEIEDLMGFPLTSS
ncbi:MAG: HDOD domain-containing protein [Anaerolineaceae bacterium]|nr:HDOD domain-containing protein [Anaerolineaceae bacterium]